MSTPKIAFVHEWLINIAGSEQVLSEMLKVFPESDLYSVIDFLNSSEKEKLGVSKIKTTFIQKLPFSKKLYKYYIVLMPIAIEQLDVSKYDIVISSSHAVAKGVVTSPSQLHICMCYSPMRYIWDMQDEYLIAANLDKGLKGWFIKTIFSKLRIWDKKSAKRVNKFIAISNFIADRIEKCYQRTSFVIYPPVDLDKFTIEKDKDDYYLALSRLVPYKRMDLIVEAFSSMPEKNLIVIGDGPDLHKIKKKATKNIKILGFQSDDNVKRYLAKAKALVFAAREDFGITLVEAQACGTPVIAYAKGGANEIIVSQGDVTGVFFTAQTVASICKAVTEFENIQDKISPVNCRKNAERFSAKRFREEFKQFVTENWNQFLLDKQ